jgi:hypothetical protein
MFDRTEYLHSRIQRIGAQLGGASTREDDFNFDSVRICTAGTILRTEMQTMLKSYPIRAHALSAPAPDAHVLRMELAQFEDEIYAIESQNYPSARYWRERDYAVDGQTRRLT